MRGTINKIMKDFVLISKLLSNFFKGKKLIAIVFTVSLLLFGISFLFVLGGFVSFFSDVNSDDVMQCLHVISFWEEQTFERTETYSDNKFFASRRYSEYNSSVLIDQQPYNVTTFSGNDNVLLNYILRDGRLFFTDEEVKTRKPVAFVSNEMCSQIGDFIRLPFWDAEFRVVGIVDDPMGRLVIVPSAWFEKANLPIRRMSFLTTRKLTIFEERKLEYDLCSDGVAKITGGVSYENMVSESTVDLAGCLVLAAVVLILGFYLFNYASQKDRYLFSLLGILGSGKMNTLFLLSLERVITTLLVMIVSSAVHYLTRDWLHRLFLLPECRMGFREYFVATAIIVIAAVFASIPFAAYFMKNSYTTVVKHCE